MILLTFQGTLNTTRIGSPIQYTVSLDCSPSPHTSSGSVCTMEWVEMIVRTMTKEGDKSMTLLWKEVSHGTWTQLECMTDRKLRCLSLTFWWYLFKITVSSFLVPSASSRVQGLCTIAVIMWSEPLQTNGRLTGYDLRFYNVYYENIVFQAGDEIFRIVKETDVPSHHGSTFVQVSSILKWWWIWNDTIQTSSYITYYTHRCTGL